MYGSNIFHKSTNGICGQVRPEYGNRSLLSPVYIAMVSPNWRKLDTQRAVFPWIFALLNEGRSKLARMAMIAMTTSSSISVNAASPQRRCALASREHFFGSHMTQSVSLPGELLNWTNPTGRLAATQSVSVSKWPHSSRAFKVPTVNRVECDLDRNTR